MNDSAYTKTVDAHWPQMQNEISTFEKESLIKKIAEYMQKNNAVLIAHYYAPPEVQALAEATGGFIGDSLAMAQYGAEHDADTLIIAGVKFMGETAKILAPTKKVIMPTLEATCSLDLNCPSDKFNQFCDAHPDRTVVVYANTSAAVKARADWVVTSSIGLQIVEHLHAQGEKILWAPDKHLGHYLQQHTGADMLLYDSACIVHEEFKSTALKQLREQYPSAAILVHPESPTEVVAMADVVGSTSQLLKAAIQMPKQQFIVATEEGIFYKMRQQAPEKQFILAPTMGKGATCRSCGYCPWMKMNDLQRMWQSLKANTNEIFVAEDTRKQALVSLNRMLEFAKQNGI